MSLVISRSAPRTGETEQAEEEADTLTVHRKITSKELAFSYSLHLLNLVCGATIFTVLSWTDDHYAEAVRKVEDASGVSLSLLIYLICPILALVSIALRAAASSMSPWKAARLPDDSEDNSCWAKFCQWWPPVPRTRRLARSIHLSVSRLPDNDKEEKQSQHEEEEEQEIPQEDVSLDKTDENSPDPSAGPSSQENVVVELSEIFAEIVKKKEKEIGK